MQQRLPMDVLSMRRYELPPPPSGKLMDISAWSECVKNSEAQLEHQAVRIENLDLMLEYGCESWRKLLDNLISQVNMAQKKLQAMRFVCYLLSIYFSLELSLKFDWLAWIHQNE